MDVAVGTLLRLGDCYERTGRLASAWARFREAASLSRVQDMKERERIATIRSNALSSRMARLVITVPPQPPPGFRIELNGMPVPAASFGSALPVDPGTLLVSADAPGFLQFERSVTVPAVDGAVVKLVVPQLEPETPPEALAPRTIAVPLRRVETLPSAPAHDAAKSKDSGYPARVTGVTLAAVGGLGLVTAGVLAAYAKKRDRTSLKHCDDDGRSCTARGVELRREALRLADAATISVAVGGGLLAAGMVIYWTAPKAEKRERAGFEVWPELGLGALGIKARGAF
jgi:serine/threonine-protein kinase